MKNTIRALSIAQPWAELVISNGKNVENRSWSTNFRGYIAIHASAAKSKDRFNAAKEYYGIDLNPMDVPFGAVVGFAKISEVITAVEVNTKTKKWFQGEFGFVLTEIIKLKKPVQAKGSLGFWKLTATQKRNCLGQLSPKLQKKILLDLATNAF